MAVFFACKVRYSSENRVYGTNPHPENRSSTPFLPRLAQTNEHALSRRPRPYRSAEARLLLAAYFQARKQSSLETPTLGRLAADLDLTSSMLYRLLQLARTYPHKPQAPLTWSHVKELLAVPDEAVRKRLTSKALQENWKVRRLRLQIQKERGPKHLQPKTTGGLKEPPRREPGIFRVKPLSLLDGGSEPVVDLGFDIYEPLRGRLSQAEEGTPLSWDARKKTWQKAGTKEDFYYYHARLERIVDGDTLLAHIFIHGRVLRRQYLRLRGLDAPPIAGAAGKRVKRRLEKKLRGNTRILLRTHLTDRYDRFIADVWAGPVYLNQALLDTGLAKKASY